MARAKPELRPCGIASGPVAASGHPKAWEFAPDPPKHAIGKFMRQSDRLGEGVLIGITRRLTCFFARKTESCNYRNAPLSEAESLVASPGLCVSLDPSEPRTPEFAHCLDVEAKLVNAMSLSLLVVDCPVPCHPEPLVPTSIPIPRV